MAMTEEDQLKMEREWATRSGVAVERVVSCLPVKNAFVDKEWTNYRLDVAWFTLHRSARDFASVCLNGGVLRTAVVAMVYVRLDSITEPLTCRLVLW